MNGAVNVAVNGAVMMPARFTLDGGEEVAADGDVEEWPNFQTDCYGFWLWECSAMRCRSTTAVASIFAPA